ncbi:thioredoxin family protein [Paracidovorax konjaci]|uniref:Thioredoxin 1 n=1 Tax=Paracidovorax konjaci TaxID=32040 RepID=A0A1I1T3B4_9BURK|nr:thioredoxin family protein [Paracidovorax konjaci]SFD53155.1 thioredoxin 1 [Paracidovorax konjaci]
MPYTAQHLATSPTREEIDRLQGPAVLEFGTPWCGFCQRAQPLIEAALKEHGNVQHIKVEDGPGRPLGRSFGVKLWPTLVFLRDGKEIDRQVRPQDLAAVQSGMHAIVHAPAISIGPA